MSWTRRSWTPIEKAAFDLALLLGRQLIADQRGFAPATPPAPRPPGTPRPAAPSLSAYPHGSRKTAAKMGARRKTGASGPGAGVL
jgi:hypothetical protein